MSSLSPLSASNLQNTINASQQQINDILKTLETGLSINSSGDDPANLYISENLNAQAYDAASTSVNAQDGLTYLQIAQKAYGDILAELDKIKDIANLTLSNTYSDNELKLFQDSITESVNKIKYIEEGTMFNDVQVFNNQSAAGLVNEHLFAITSKTTTLVTTYTGSGYTYEYVDNYDTTNVGLNTAVNDYTSSITIPATPPPPIDNSETIINGGNGGYIDPVTQQVAVSGATGPAADFIDPVTHEIAVSTVTVPAETFIDPVTHEIAVSAGTILPPSFVDDVTHMDTTTLATTFVDPVTHVIASTFTGPVVDFIDPVTHQIAVSTFTGSSTFIDPVISVTSTTAMTTRGYKLVDYVPQITSAQAQAGTVLQVTEAQAISSGYDDAHIIHTASEFVSKISADLAGKFIIVNNLNMSALGTLTNSAITGTFTGQLDGNGYQIQNLTINATGGSDVGLFANVSGAKIKDLTITNMSATSTNGNQIGLLAANMSGSMIDNVSVAGTISLTPGGYYRVGGLIGRATGGTVSNSSANVAITIAAGSIYSEGVGGLIGYSSLSNITKSHASGNIIASDNLAGGLVGKSWYGSISDSYATGNVTATGKDYVGGLVGESNGTISKSYATGNVSGNASVGGFAGHLNGGTATDSYATGNVTGGGTSTGGFAGLIDTYATITNSYAATGTITNGTGGFLGTLGANGTAGNTNFYKNNLSTTGGTAINANALPMTNATGAWSTSIWDKSGALPVLLNIAPVTNVYDTAHIINNAAEFVSKISADLAGKFILANDIDMSALGTLTNSAITGTFTGALDGNGYKVQNLTINTGASNVTNVGLFSQLDKATIKNLSITNMSITAMNSSNVGGLAGKSTLSLIDNASASGTMAAYSVAGMNYYYGGLIGNASGSVLNSFSNVAITDTGYGTSSIGIGGLIGGTSAIISHSYALGNITSSSNSVGGLVGSGGTISNSYALGNVTSTGNNIGGLVGTAGGTINQSYATGNVSGNSSVGGLVGYTSDNIANSYAIGNVTGTGTEVAGFAGQVNAYAAITTSYAAIGNVTNGSGGFVGSIGSSATVNSSNFYKNNMVTDAAGSLATTNIKNATGSFNSTIWDVNSFAYPVLKANPEVKIYDAAHIINNAAEFVSKIGADLAGSFILAADIDMSALGTLTNSAITGTFTGALDGNGHKINNLTINTGGAAVNNIGLFSNINNGTIQDLSVTNVSITATNSNNVGGLAGTFAGHIGNTYTTGTIIGKDTVGGLFGIVTGYNSTAITDSFSTANVTGGRYVGGLAGTNGAFIYDSYATGNVNATKIGFSDAGGLVGYNTAEINTSYAMGNVTAAGGDVGGLVGSQSGAGARIYDSYALGNVNSTGGNFVGGFIGANGANGYIKNSYAVNGAVTAVGTKGGFAGTHTGLLLDGTNFYQNNLSTTAGSAIDADVTPMTDATWSWSTSTWDRSGTRPELINNPEAPTAATFEPIAGYNTAHVIYTAAEFVSKINADRAGSFILANDIDMSTLGTLTNSAITGIFTGKLDGNGYKIDNLTIDTGAASVNYIGLFSNIDGSAEILDLELEDVSITATASAWVGALAGNINAGSVTNSYSTGVVTGGARVGGLVGDSAATITNSFSTVTVLGQNTTGGLVAGNYGTITNSYAAGDVTASSGASSGGFAANNSGNISNSYATGNVTGKNETGGFVGKTNAGTINNSYSTGNVTGTIQVGGFVGRSQNGTVTNSYAANGTVTGTSDLGGFLGYMWGGSIDATNFYKNNRTTDAGSAIDADVTPMTNATGTWSSAIWDKSGARPLLINNPEGATAVTFEPIAGYNTAHVIYNAAEFVSKISADLGGSFILANDIDMSTLGALTDSAITGTFTGSLDGNGYKIDKFAISFSSTANKGLFSQLNGAHIQDVAITNLSINAANSDYVGGLAGVITNTTIDNTYATGTVRGINYTGGLVGSMTTSTITDSYTSVDVRSGLVTAGGFVAVMNSGSITQSYSMGKVGTYTGYAAGFVGQQAGGTISESYSTANASGNNAAGFVGWASGGSITNSYATGDVTALNAYSGGFVAHKAVGSTITNSYAAKGIVAGGVQSGGFAGYVAGTLDNTNFYQNNMIYTQGSPIDADVTPMTNATGAWSAAIWNKSGALPLLINATEQTGQTIYDAAHTIHTAAEFVSKINANASGSFILANDIDMSTLGTLTNSVIAGLFTGSLDGNGYKIQNLTINTYGAAISNIGLFAQLSGSIRDVAMENTTITATASTKVGGLAGNFDGGEIINSYVEGDITGNTYIGGLVGYAQNGTRIRDSFTQGTVTGPIYAGGLVGYADGTASQIYVTNSYSDSDVVGNQGVGGLIGFADTISVTSSHATGDVTKATTGHGMGGFIGYAQNSTIGFNYATGNVTGASNVGGFIGNAYSNNMNANYALGSVTGTTNEVGGFVGRMGGTNYISNSYAKGNVAGASYVGGFAGYGDDTAYVYRSYAAQTSVTGSTNTGGFVGYLGGSSSVAYTVGSYSFYKNNLSSGYGGNYTSIYNANITPVATATSGWISPWNTSGALPVLAGNPEPVGFQPIAGYNPAHVIYTAAEFVSKINADLGGSFILANDIDMSELAPMSTAAITGTFTGALDGNGYKINNLNITAGAATNVGLFAKLDGADIVDLAVENISINTINSDNVGGLAGYITNGSTITNSYTTGTINGKTYTGGLVGYADAFSIITKSHSSADVTGLHNVGGLVGRSFGGVSITNSNAKGNVTGTGNGIGGFIGYTDSAVSTSYATGNVNGLGQVGGFIGMNQGTISNSYSLGNVTGNDSVAGFVGDNSYGTITNSYAATGNVAGNSNIAGFAGSNSGTINNTNFYKNNMAYTQGSAIDADVTPMIIATVSWSAAIWDKSGTLPTLIDNPDEITSDPIPGYNTAHVIYTAAEFVSKINADLGGSFILANDINMADLGTLTNSAITGTFTGSLDGNGYKVDNLTINTGGAAVDNIGLFSQLNTADIVDLAVTNVSITATNSYNVGGLAGFSDNSSVTNSYTTGNVTGRYHTGGLVGLSGNSSTITNSYATANVTGYEQTGGLVGRHNFSTITNSYATGNVTGNYYYTGGLVGNNSASNITKSYATGNVIGNGYTGGLAGWSGNSSDINNSYTTGNVNGTNYTGGFIGSSDYGVSIISNSYAANGTVTGTTDVGGFAGYLGSGNINNTNFYKNNMTTTAGSAIDADVTPMTNATGVWSAAIWDKSGALPLLIDNPEGAGAVDPIAGFNTAHVIYTAAEFVSKISADLAGNFILANDINMADLGTLTNSAITGTFTGSLDGNGHKVDNLTINTAAAPINNIGLFSILDGADIFDIEVEDVNINAVNSDKVGAIAGYINNSSSVNNSFANGTIVGHNNVGGLVGFVQMSSTISNSDSLVTVTGYDNVGGITGQLASGSITNSYASRNVTGTHNYAGGLVGYVSGVGATVSASYATGNVAGVNYVGGFAGGNTGTITNTFAVGAVTGTDRVGGFVGSNALGTINTSYAANGDVTGTTNIGGFAGSNIGTINNLNFYKNNMTTTAGSAVDAHVTTVAVPTATWSGAVWDKSHGLPVLIKPGVGNVTEVGGATEVPVITMDFATNKLIANMTVYNSANANEIFAEGEDFTFYTNDNGVTWKMDILSDAMLNKTIKIDYEAADLTATNQGTSGFNLYMGNGTNLNIKDMVLDLAGRLDFNITRDGGAQSILGAVADTEEYIRLKNIRVEGDITLATNALENKDEKNTALDGGSKALNSIDEAKQIAEMIKKQLNLQTANTLKSRLHALELSKAKMLMTFSKTGYNFNANTNSSSIGGIYSGLIGVNNSYNSAVDEYYYKNLYDQLKKA